MGTPPSPTEPPASWLPPASSVEAPPAPEPLEQPALPPLLPPLPLADEPPLPEEPVLAPELAGAPPPLAPEAPLPAFAAPGLPLSEQPAARRTEHKRMRFLAVAFLEGADDAGHRCSAKCSPRAVTPHGHFNGSVLYRTRKQSRTDKSLAMPMTIYHPVRPPGCGHFTVLRSRYATVCLANRLVVRYSRRGSFDATVLTGRERIAATITASGPGYQIVSSE